MNDPHIEHEIAETAMRITQGFVRAKQMADALKAGSSVADVGQHGYNAADVNEEITQMLIRLAGVSDPTEDPEVNRITDRERELLNTQLSRARLFLDSAFKAAPIDEHEMFPKAQREYAQLNATLSIAQSLVTIASLLAHRER